MGHRALGKISLTNLLFSDAQTSSSREIVHNAKVVTYLLVTELNKQENLSYDLDRIFLDADLGVMLCMG